MKIRENCQNELCLAKSSMIPVYTKIYYKNKDNRYRTHKDPVVFFICKKCCWMSDFRLNEIRSSGVFWICLVPKQDNKKIRKMKKKKKPECLYCESSIFPLNPGKNELTKHSVIRLYLGKNKIIFGYFCLNHRLAFCIPLKKIKWENVNERFVGTGTFNVLDPLNSAFPKEEREKDERRFNEDNGLLERYVVFKKIGGFTPTLDISDQSLENFQILSIRVPRGKINRFTKMLESKGYEIVK